MNCHGDVVIFEEEVSNGADSEEIVNTGISSSRDHTTRNSLPSPATKFFNKRYTEPSERMKKNRVGKSVIFSRQRRGYGTGILDFSFATINGDTPTVKDETTSWGDESEWCDTPTPSRRPSPSPGRDSQTTDRWLPSDTPSEVARRRWQQQTSLRASSRFRHPPRIVTSESSSATESATVRLTTPPQELMRIGPVPEPVTPKARHIGNNSISWIRINAVFIAIVAIACIVLFFVGRTAFLWSHSSRASTYEKYSQDRRYYSGADDDWRPDPKAIVRLMFSRNSSQTIMDSKILYHLQSIENQQTQLKTDMQKQFDDSSLTLQAMAAEIKNLHLAFSKLVDGKRMERKLELLTKDLKYYQERVTRRDVPKVVTKTVKPQILITTRTKVINIATKTQFVIPTHCQVPNNINGVDRVGVRPPQYHLSENEVNTRGYESKRSSWWLWNRKHSQYEPGNALDTNLPRSSKMIMQLLCPGYSGWLDDGISGDFKRCLRDRKAASSSLGHANKQNSGSANQILTIVASFSNDMPPTSISLFGGLVIVVYAEVIARWVASRRMRLANPVMRAAQMTTVVAATTGAIMYPIHFGLRWLKRRKPLPEPTWISKAKHSILEFFAVVGKMLYDWLPFTRRESPEVPPLPEQRDFRIIFFQIRDFTTNLMRANLGDSLGRNLLVLKFAALLTIFLLVSWLFPSIRTSATQYLARAHRVARKLFSQLQYCRIYITREWVAALPMMIFLIAKHILSRMYWRTYRLLATIKRFGYSRTMEIGNMRPRFGNLKFNWHVPVILRPSYVLTGIQHVFAQVVQYYTKRTDLQVSTPVAHDAGPSFPTQYQPPHVQDEDEENTGNISV